MKILVISRTPWNESNSFGNTFSNLFSGMEDLQIYNVCCQHGNMCTDVVSAAFQMTDKSALRSIYKRNASVGWKMDNTESNAALNAEISASAKKNKSFFKLGIRDIIWKLSRYKKSKELASFVSECAPDIIYLPIYASGYMCDIQEYLIKKIDVPVVGHISDDVYGYPPRCSHCERRYRSKIRKKIKRLISKCSYLEVFAENMKREYEGLFGVPCYVIGKGVDASVIPASINAELSSSPKFVYTGNLGAGRYEVIAELGHALDSVSPNATLDVYSATDLTEDMAKLFSESKSIRFMGRVGREEVDRVQGEADVLVHVEGFTPEAVHSARMSFSTKIIDYMLKGKPIFAIGPSEVNSIELLKSNGLAVVADSREAIMSAAESLVSGGAQVEKILFCVREYLLTKRNIRVIQKGIKERLDELVL